MMSRAVSSPAILYRTSDTALNLMINCQNRKNIWNNCPDSGRRKRQGIKIVPKNRFGRKIEKMKDKSKIRDSILSAAASLFEQYGYEKTTMDEIAAASHKAKASIYYHFDSKIDIFKAVLRQEMEYVRNMTRLTTVRMMLSTAENTSADAHNMKTMMDTMQPTKHTSCLRFKLLSFELRLPVVSSSSEPLSECRKLSRPQHVTINNNTKIVVNNRLSEFQWVSVRSAMDMIMPEIVRKNTSFDSSRTSSLVLALLSANSVLFFARSVLTTVSLSSFSFL